MNITLTPYIQSFGMTPTELLERRQNGVYTEYKHDASSDKLQNELNILADTYRNDLSIENKKNILKKEYEILWQELKHPELTLARNYESIREILPCATGQELTDSLRLFSLEGLSRMLNLNSELCLKFSDDNLNSLKDVFTDFSEDTRAGRMGKNKIINIMSCIKPSNPKKAENLKNVWKYMYENSQSQEIKNTILCRQKYIDNKELFENLKNDSDNDDLFRQVLMHSKVNDEEVTEYINNILKSDNVDKDIMRSAVLGAGKFRSDENFEIIKEIALNKDEEDIRKREFAIHSTALYLKEKPEEVNEIMFNIMVEGSVFSPLAMIIKDKINGNYHGQVDREIHYANLSPERTADFKERLSNYVVSDKELNIQQMNALHRSMIPFRKYLPESNDNYYTFYLSNDTLTRFKPHMAGKRRFVKNAKLSYSGDFFDSMGGVNSQKMALMDFSGVSSKDHSNAVAHEMGHHIEYGFSGITSDIDLYAKNMSETALDDYATNSPSEYFAVGCDAYASIYVPHKYLLNKNTGVHSRYELMDKDPDLYGYIDNLAKRF